MRQVAVGRSRSGAGSSSLGTFGSHAGLGPRSARVATGRSAAAPDAAAAFPRPCLAVTSALGHDSTSASAELTSSSGCRDRFPASARYPVAHYRGVAIARAALCRSAASSCASTGSSSSSATCSSGYSSSASGTSSTISTTAHKRRGWGGLPAVPCGLSASPRHPHPSRAAAADGGPSPFAAASAASASSASAASSAADRDSMSVEFVVESSGLKVAMRKVRTLDELRQVATLRADAYYAENQSRFVGSLKKKFVEQEVESLQQRTSATSKQGAPFCECLVAVESDCSTVLGCIDLRLPAALNGVHPAGVPADDTSGCYLLNVVVREDVRGQGLGRAIMRAAMGRAVHTWGAQRLYTHVEADNEVAYNLYAGCGFTKHSTDVRYEAETKLGQTVLLQADAELVRGG